MTSDALLQKILNHPQAPQLLKRVKVALEKEKRARIEFRNRLQDDEKAEFINGKIIRHTPTRRGHSAAGSHLSQLLHTFVSLYDLGELAREKALVACTRNDYLPDICFWKNEKTVDFGKDTMIHPAPDFITEILSKGTEKKDRGVKFEDYAKHGVEEYWLIDYRKEKIERYLAEDEVYVLDKIYGKKRHD